MHLLLASQSGCQLDSCYLYQPVGSLASGCELVTGSKTEEPLLKNATYTRLTCCCCCWLVWVSLKQTLPAETDWRPRKSSTSSDWPAVAWIGQSLATLWIAASTRVASKTQNSSPVVAAMCLPVFDTNSRRRRRRRGLLDSAAGGCIAGAATN